MERLSLPIVAAVLLCWSTHPASAQTLFPPTPYLSSADIPAGFYAGGSPTALEDFEDGSLDFGITVSPLPVEPSPLGIIGPCPSCDSVDGDDGVIDGLGIDGHSWFYVPGVTGATFTFPSLVTAAGIVWTDGQGPTTFEAFGPGMVSLGTVGPVLLEDASLNGTTAEDRFFGVQHSAGILAIKLSNAFGGIEVDHVQFGTAAGLATPVPAVPPELLVMLAAVLMISGAWAASPILARRVSRQKR